MMSQPDGIRLDQSGWTNPDGFQKEARPPTPTTEVKACEVQGPDGWVCDLPPQHPNPDRHWADDGTPQGIWWIQNYTNVQGLGESDPVMIPATTERVHGGTIQKILALAEEALDSERAADWAAALKDIQRLCNE
jgi:hypothetical protein